jgi:chemotaxis protein methyltransferase CheR
MNLVNLELTAKQYERVCGLVYATSGINLGKGKEQLVRTRLAKRVQTLGMSSYTDYLDLVERDLQGSEAVVMLDAISTNKTFFFREVQHFDLLRDRVLPPLLASGSPVRVWSAGCSSGDEPYTLGILLHEMEADLARRDVRILATDLSTKVLAKARQGLYDASTLSDVPPALLKRYFTREGGAVVQYRVADRVRSLVSFARLNLMEAWPMRGPFDVIFCRNVMIYFDRPTQERLIQRYYDLLSPGGYLLVGHSESLTSLKHRFRYVQPAVYVK